MRSYGEWRGCGYDCSSYEDPKRGHTETGEAVGMIVVHMMLTREEKRRRLERLWV